MTKYKFHPLSEMLPLMNQGDFTEFVSHVKEHGQLVPIVLLDGKILDGRNRYNACVELGIEPRVANYSKEQAKDYVIGTNLFRRHYLRMEKESILKRLLARQDSLGMTNKEVAQSSGMSQSSVARAKRKKVSKGGGLTTSHVEDEKMRDLNGTEVPRPAQFHWIRVSEVKLMVNQIKACLGQVEKIVEGDPLYTEVNVNGVKGDLKSAISRLDGAFPGYVCPYCDGQKPESCKECKGRGWMSEFMWKNSVPSTKKHGAA